jgi:hypothetical protein
MKKLFGLFGSEKAVVLTAAERLEIISNKAQDAVDFSGIDEGESKFAIGTDGYDVEEITHEEMERQLEESRVAGIISRLEDPTMALQDNGVVTTSDRNDPWGDVSDKGRVSGGN